MASGLDLGWFPKLGDQHIGGTTWSRYGRLCSVTNYQYQFDVYMRSPLHCCTRNLGPYHLGLLKPLLSALSMTTLINCHILGARVPYYPGSWVQNDEPGSATVCAKNAVLEGFVALWSLCRSIRQAA